MMLVALAALWLVLGVLVCLIVVALCRAGTEEDEHRAAMEQRPRPRPRRGSGSRPAV